MLNAKQLYKSFSAAFRGLALVFESEQNFRIHSICALCAIGLGLFLRISIVEFLLLCVTITLVLACEIINTGLERFLDVIRPRVLPAVRDIKDMMAGLVLLAALLSLAIGLGILLPPLIGAFVPLSP